MALFHSSHGVCIHYLLEGEGETVVLLQGVGRSLVAWPSSLLKTLQQAGYRTLIYDHRDTGLSTWFAADSSYSMQEKLRQIEAMDLSSQPYQLLDMVADLSALLEHLCLHKVHLLGYSMGGMLAQLLALSCQDGVKSLTLINTHSGEERCRIAPDPKSQLLLLSSPRGHHTKSQSEYLQKLFRRLAGPGSSTSASQWQYLSESLAAYGYSNVGQHHQMLAIAAAPDRSQVLGALHLPCLIVQGEQDPLVAPRAAEQLKHCLRGSTVAKVQGMGHELESHYLPVWTPALLHQLASS